MPRLLLLGPPHSLPAPVLTVGGRDLGLSQKLHSVPLATVTGSGIGTGTLSGPGRLSES